MDELVGRADLLEVDEAIDHWKARGVDLEKVLSFPEVAEGAPRRRVRGPEPVLDDALDWELIDAAGPALERGERVELERPLRNVNRAVGGLLSSEIARTHGAAGLAEETIQVRFRGSAGQSFGAWLAPGVSFTLQGDANDYTGKGMSGGVLAVMPARRPHLLGAGQRDRRQHRPLRRHERAAPSSAAWPASASPCATPASSAVVEGLGDHGCEYMTGGRVVVLGSTGRNFAAGMSGGIAYVLDEEGAFPGRCNMELVDFEEIGPDEEIELRGLIAEHAQRTGSPVAERVLSSLGVAAAPLRQGHAARLQARAGRPRG